MHTNAADVRGVLQAAHITVGEHDLVAPDESAPVADGDAVVVRRGHLLHLLVNGAARNVWVNADSVDEALNQLGYGSQNLVSVSRSSGWTAASPASRSPRRSWSPSGWTARRSDGEPSARPCGRRWTRPT